MRHIVRLLSGLILASWASASSAQSVLTFSDQSENAGVSATQISGGGVVGDFNNDGFQDIFIPPGRISPDMLFINNTDGTFTDRAAEWGVAVTHRGRGAAVADFNGDGWLDIFVISLGPEDSEAPGHHRLYKNTGKGSFVNVAESAGVNWTTKELATGYSAAWGDYDLDGDLDLAVTVWRRHENANLLFRNNGDETFTDVTEEAGLLDGLADVAGFTVRFVDMDGDRYPELIWIGDFNTSRYFVNNRDGTFSDFTEEAGTNRTSTDMGMTVADFDADGLPDFYVTTIRRNQLFINQGGNRFVNFAPDAGVEVAGWGWATVGIDLNHDTLVDIVSATQSGRQYAFINVTAKNGPLRFRDETNNIGLVTSIHAHGLAGFDYDNDGDQDLIFFPRRGDLVKLFRNDLVGPAAHWLRVFLDTAGAPGIAPNGIGTVLVATVGPKRLLGRIDGGCNYLSQSELSAHFGLGEAKFVDELRIEWNDGRTTVLTDVPANQTITFKPLGLGATGDADGDGDVDLVDFAALFDCRTGPGADALPYGCHLFDFDGDNDVDLLDFASIQKRITE